MPEVRTSRAGDISPSNRFEQAYAELRTAILDGRYAPNTRLTEAALTQSLKISRTTLRSVLVRLANEGYVTSSMNIGVRTPSFDAAEAVDRLRVRETLEGSVAALAAERATPTEVDELSDLVEQMRKAKEARDEHGYSSANHRFHAGIVRAGRSPTVAKFIDSTLYPLVLMQYRDRTMVHPRPGSFEEHQAILSAIVTRNPAAAEAAMRHHVAAAGRFLLFPRESRPQRDNDWSNGELASQLIS